MGLKKLVELFQFREDYDEFDDEEFDDDIRTGSRNLLQDNSMDDEFALQEDLLESPSKFVAEKKQDMDQRKVRSVKMDRAMSSNKVVPIKSSAKNLEVCILKPTAFADSQQVCDMLLSGRAAVVNLEGFDTTEAQRIMDFISGCVYAVSGRLHQISRYIFIFSPESIDISGDYLDLLPVEGFGVPIINKEF